MAKAAHSKLRVDGRSAAAVRVAPADGGGRRLAVGRFLLLGILLVLALRLTMAEWVRAPLDERTGVRVTEELGEPAVSGTVIVVGLAIVTLALGGGALLVAPARRREWVRLGLIGGILALALASTCRAAAPFPALVGTCDLAMGLVGGWAVSLLARSVERKQLVLCVLVAVALAWGAKGFYWRFVELPDTVQYYQDNKPRLWAEHGWTADSNAKNLYEARMFSSEPTGFLAFSNNFAEGLIPLMMVGLGMTVLGLRRAWEKPAATTKTVGREGGGSAKPRAGEPVAPIAAVAREVDERSLLVVLVAVMVLLLVGLAVLLGFTQSKGASAALAVCALLFVGGVAFPDFVARRRVMLLWSIGAVLVLGVAAVVGYGMARQGLPSRSLLFRWHYWTGAARMIRDDAHAWLGVGLNNFGDYYMQFKIPYSPEDVKDPHNIFVRFASELGLPALGLVAVLIGCGLRGVFAGPRTAVADGELRRLPFKTGAVVAAVFCVVWWIIRALVAEPGSDLATRGVLALFDGFYGLLAFAGFMLGAALLNLVPGAWTRVLCLAGALGAAGMLLYDQVNMGLVTGPVAMLFWVMLGACEPPETDAVEARTTRVGMIAGGVMLAVSAVLVLSLWAPVAAHTFAWDNTERELRMKADLSSFYNSHDPAKLDQALAALDQALVYDSRSVPILKWKVDLEVATGRRAAADIRRMFALNPSDAVLLMRLGAVESDLPVAERIAALQHALWVDEQSRAAGERPNLTDRERELVRRFIGELERGPSTTAAATQGR